MNLTITGTTRGLGAELKLLAELKYTVTSLNRPEYDLEDLSTLNTLDFTDTDVLILNAGHQLGGKDFFTNIAVDHWTKIVECNLIGNLYLIQRYLQQRDIGTLVVVSSAVINKRIDDSLVYSASKAALSNAILNLRLEIQNQGKKIRLLEVIPSRTRHSDEDDGSGRQITTYKNAAKSIMYAVQTPAISKLEL